MPTIIELLYDNLKPIFERGWANLQVLINWTVVIVATAFALQWWLRYEEKPMVLFVGPPGSTSSNIGGAVVSEISGSLNSNGAAFAITQEPTPMGVNTAERFGYEKNRVALGIVQDVSITTGNHKNMRALLPLEWNYLFVICSRDFLEKVKNSQKARTCFKSDSKDGFAHSLGDVIHYFVNDEQPRGRMYLGPRNSSTYQMASIALRKYCNLDSIHQETGYFEGEDICDGIRERRFELTFHVGPIGNSIIREIANDGKSVLLSLGEITEAI